MVYAHNDLRWPASEEFLVSVLSSIDLYNRQVEVSARNLKRLETLETLHENGIYSVLFMSPVFPGITEYREIIEKTSGYVDEYWFG